MNAMMVSLRPTPQAEPLTFNHYRDLSATWAKNREWLVLFSPQTYALFALEQGRQSSTQQPTVNRQPPGLKPTDVKQIVPGKKKEEKTLFWAESFPERV